jgi:imidazole glycerol-phosphate synthase subunit HisF
MFRPRVIPVLLVKNGALVKSQNFKKHAYIGDPLNAVRIFNELKADELTFLDIAATQEKRIISSLLVKEIAEEATMPFSVGGGIKELSQIKDLITTGAEKVVIGSYAVTNPEFIRQASGEFGSTTITVCIDVKRNWQGKERVWSIKGSKQSTYTPLQFAQLMEEHGAGEVIIQSIDNDGKMQGYDLELIKKISNNLTIPVVALGGAGCYDDLIKTFSLSHVSGLAAGSLFVYYGRQKGVLINYPQKHELNFYES